MISTGGISLYTKTSMFGFFPNQINFGWAFCTHYFSRQEWKDWGRICYPKWFKEECRNHQCRRYSNTPYIPRGTSCTLYLDMGTFPGGVASTQIPLGRLHLHQLLLFIKSEVLLPSKVEKEGLKMYPHFSEFLWDMSEEDHHLSNPMSLSIPLPAPALILEVCTHTKGGLYSHSACTKTEGGLGCHAASTQTEGLGYQLSLKLLWETNQARTQLECELIQDMQELAERYEHN